MRVMMDGGRAYDELDELYDVWCSSVEEDVPFYLGLAASLAAELGRDALEIVELGAGSGRLTAHLAAAGHRVVAIDAAERQLARLRARVDAARVDIRHADMLHLADLVEPASVDLVLAPFRSLLHVTAQRDNVLRAVTRVLRPGGALAFDVFHPAPEQVTATDGRWIKRATHAVEDGAWRFDERASYAPVEDGYELRVDVRCRFTPARRRGAARAQRHALLELRTIPPSAWAASIAEAGLHLDGAYGWFDARPLHASDDDSVWVARRPAAP